MAEASNPAGEIDYTALAGLSQEEVNKRLLAAMLQQGSGKYDQALMADALARSRGPVPLGPRGRGFVGELNDFATAFRPGMERSSAQAMAEKAKLADQAFMVRLLRGEAPGANRGQYALTQPNQPGAQPPPGAGQGIVPPMAGRPAQGLRPGAPGGLNLGLRDDELQIPPMYNPYGV
jgi:hypothetical protein